MDSSGTLLNQADMIKSMGFHTGKRVLRKSDKTEAEIIDMEGDVVKLRVYDENGEEKGLFTISAATFISGEWKEVAFKKPQEKLAAF